MTDAMSLEKRQNARIESLREHTRQVDHACRRYLGVSIMAWRAIDSLVSLGALMLAGYAIDQGAEPTVALVLAAAIISGPKALEWWLVREDLVDPGNSSFTESDGSD